MLFSFTNRDANTSWASTCLNPPGTAHHSATASEEEKFATLQVIRSDERVTRSNMQTPVLITPWCCAKQGLGSSGHPGIRELGSPITAMANTVAECFRITKLCALIRCSGGFGSH